MHDFERSLTRSIPQHEAAGFLYRIKHADWTEAPDETGMLEGAFTAPLEQVIASLTEVIAAKFRKMVAYHVYAESMRGVAQHAVAEVFHEHAEQERAAAEAYLKRAASLGSGPVHLPEIESPPASADPVGILTIMARAEQEGIAAQAALKQMVGEQNPLGYQIEQFMIEDQHHLDELWQMMPADVVRTPLIDQAPAGAMPAALPEASVEQAPQPEEKPAPAPKIAADLMSLRRAVASGGKQVAEEAANAGKGTWSSFNSVGKGLTPGQIAMGAGALGAGVGTGTSLMTAAVPAEQKQQLMEEEGPIGRAQLRHPALMGALRGGVAGAGIGLGVNKMIQHAGSTPTKALLKSAPYLIAGSASSAGLGTVDAHLHQKELEARAKEGSAVADRLRKEFGAVKKTVENVASAAPKKNVKALGERLRQGVERYGELVSGSKARALASKAHKPFVDAVTAAHEGVNAGKHGLFMEPGHKKKLVDRFQKGMKRSRRIGDLAKKENTVSRLTQAGTAAVVGGAALAASGSKNSRDNAKIDRTNERLKKAFVLALDKLGFAPPEPGAGTDPGAAPLPDQQQMMTPQPSMAAPGPQPPMATPPGQAKYSPINYLEAEETARNAQEANEAQFYRGKAEEAGMQVQDMATQIQDVQGQLDQLSAQSAEANAQIMAANEQAVQANDQMLNQATLAARMRMGMQQLRAQMMEIASQDPEQLAAAAGGPTPMDVGNQAAMAEGGPAALGDPLAGAAPGGDPAAPGADPGTPGASPDPNAPPGAAPAGASGPPSASGSPDESQKSDGDGGKKDPAETTVSIKKGSTKTADMMSEALGKLPYMAAGGAIGAGAGYLGAKRGKEILSLRQKVDELKGQQDGGFGKSIELAKAQLALGEKEQAQQNPGRSALQGGLTGAALGGALATAIPAGISGGQRLMKNLSVVRENMV